MQSIVRLANCLDDHKMVDYLQKSAEEDRASLSRELHDELGGLLVSAVMDIAFAEQTMALDEGLRQRLSRVRRTVAEAIDLKRKIIENLRPSMLDNLGLFQALKWEVKQRCGTLHLAYSEIYPEAEPRFTKEASIALFRVAQQSLNVALHQPSVTAARIAVSIDMDILQIAISHDGLATTTLTQEDTSAICLIAHRARAFGGRLTVTNLSEGGAMYSAQLPLALLTAPPLLTAGE
jgi:signal transduction histidine kinase